MCNITFGKLKDYFISNKHAAKDYKFCEFSDDDIQYLIEQEKKYPRNIYSEKDTIELIVKNKLSCARIGDGEFLVMCGIKNVHGNNNYKKLRTDLLDICQKGSNDKCLVCINKFGLYNGTSKWFCYYYLIYLDLIFKNIIFNNKNFYGDAYAFKYFILNIIDIRQLSFNNKRQDVILLNNNNLEYIKKIWENKHVVFVVNDKSLIIEDKNNLFTQVISKNFIYVPDKSCYGEYDRIYANILNYPKNYLIYLECGEMATVLAYNLSQIGYQALDMGDFYKRIFDLKSQSTINIK